MASTGTPARSFIFKTNIGEGIRGASGGATYAPSGYARAYLDSSALAEKLKNEQEMEMQREAAVIAAEKDARAEERLRLQQEIQDRQQRHQAFMEKITADKEILAMKNLEREQAMEVQAAKVLDAVAELPVYSPNFQKAVKQLRSDQFAGQVLTGKYRTAVDNALKEKTKEFTDYIKPIMQDAKNVGYTGGIENLPINDAGDFDREKIYGNNGLFDQSFKAMSTRMAEQGMFPQTDESGKVVFKAREPQITEEQIVERARTVDPSGERLGISGFTAKGQPIIRAGSDFDKVVPLNQAYPKKFSKEAQAGVESSGMAGGTAFIPSTPTTQPAVITEQASVTTEQPKPSMTMQDFLRSRQEAQQPQPEVAPQTEPVDEQAQ